MQKLIVNPPAVRRSPHSVVKTICLMIFAGLITAFIMLRFIAVTEPTVPADSAEMQLSHLN